MRRVRKAVTWLLFNGVFAVLAYMAVVDGVQWASNIVRSVVWVSVILYVLLMFFIDEMIDSEPEFATTKAMRSVPKWLSVAFDMCLMLLFVYAGWFLIATLQLVASVCLEAIFQKAAEHRADLDALQTT